MKLSTRKIFSYILISLWCKINYFWNYKSFRNKQLCWARVAHSMEWFSLYHTYHSTYLGWARVANSMEWFSLILHFSFYWCVLGQGCPINGLILPNIKLLFYLLVLGRGCPLYRMILPYIKLIILLTCVESWLPSL